MKAKTISMFILERLAEVGEGAFESFFPRNYPEARLWRKVFGIDPPHHFPRRTFSTILSRLRRQGLVAHRGNKRHSPWSITKKGKEMISRFEFLPPSDGILRLVIFDIPEAERKKRDAIRRELTACEFNPLQKSVWAGRRPLPKDFMELLDVLKMKKCVHIFSVRDSGTLEIKNT